MIFERFLGPRFCYTLIYKPKRNVQSKVSVQSSLTHLRVAVVAAQGRFATH